MTDKAVSVSIVDAETLDLSHHEASKAGILGRWLINKISGGTLLGTGSHIFNACPVVDFPVNGLKKEEPVETVYFI